MVRAVENQSKMSDTATVTETPARFGPAPAGFLITLKSLDSVTALLEQPIVYQQVRSLLIAAENELFLPLLEAAKPTDFTQQFEFFANRYFPIRLQTLLSLANAIGVERFRTEYFQQIPKLVISLSQHANIWGLEPTEVADSFDKYFASAKSIISIAPHLPLAPAEPILRLVTSITEIDFGFTCLGLVFEGTMNPVRWTVHELFRLTRRSLLVYEDATRALVNYVESSHPGQEELDFDAAYHAAVINIAGYRPGVDDPPASDMRSTFRKYRF